MASIRPFTYRPPAELHKRLRDEAWKRHLSVQKLMDMMLTAQLNYWDLLEANEIARQAGEPGGNGRHRRVPEGGDDVPE